MYISEMVGRPEDHVEYGGVDHSPNLQSRLDRQSSEIEHAIQDSLTDDEPTIDDPQSEEGER